MLTKDTIPARILDRFWDNVVRGGDNECWPYRGSRDKGGYGRIGRSYIKAHRLMYALAKGNVPDNLVVRHTCDNPPCVNPAHLLLGTSAENTADKVARNRCSHAGPTNPLRGDAYREKHLPERRARGARIGLAKLDDDKVLEIKDMFASGTKLAPIARRYGVTPAAIRFIIIGRTWTHVE